MRTVYIDSNLKFHPTPDAAMTAVETDFFNGKCDVFVEGFCCDQEDYTKIYPWKPFGELDAAQRKYERDQLAEYESLINELYAEVTA